MTTPPAALDPGRLKRERAVMIAAALLVTIVAAASLTGRVTFQTLDLPTVTSTLTNLLLVALVLERALEVFITAYRSPGRAADDAVLKRITKEIATLSKLPDHAVLADGSTKKEARLAQLASDREPIDEKLENYKARTQVIAMRSGIILGLLTAAVGYRILGEIVTATSLDGFQASAFVFVDVLLTGGLLAGGSKGIHSLTSLFGNYLDTAAEGAKGS